MAEFINITTVSELKDYVSTGDNIILKVGSHSCGPCVTLTFNLQMVMSEYPNVKFLEVDADDTSDELIEYLNVRNIPLLVKYTKGAEVARSTGMKTIDQLKEFIG